ncbi:hypothetical protein BVX98_05470 [bacterium F11]|nr:hypothetical protein BVX98_05470 [bacterium F11]
MTTTVLILTIVILLVINVILWKSGSVQTAETPETLLDRPLMDPKERKAILKRLKRWKEEGKLTRSEYDVFQRLCDAEWDAEV